MTSVHGINNNENYVPYCSIDSDQTNSVCRAGTHTRIQCRMNTTLIYTPEHHTRSKHLLHHILVSHWRQLSAHNDNNATICN